MLKPLNFLRGFFGWIKVFLLEFSNSHFLFLAFQNFNVEKSDFYIISLQFLTINCSVKNYYEKKMYYNFNKSILNSNKNIDIKDILNIANEYSIKKPKNIINKINRNFLN